MADVQIQQTPGERSNTGWVWAIVVILLLALIAWFVFAGGNRDDTLNIDADINTPGAPAGGGGTPPPAGGGGGNPPPRP